MDNDYNVPMPYDQYFLDMRNKSHQKHSVLIAVLDTGVDPGALGLQTCPDGSPKVIDIIDCSGSDDVSIKLTTVDDDTIAPYLESIYKYMDFEDEDIEYISQYLPKVESSEYVRFFSQFKDCKFYKGCRSLKSFMSDRKYNLFDQKQKDFIDSCVLNVIIYEDSTNDSVCVIDYNDISSDFIVIEEYHIENKYGQIPIGDNLYLTFGFHLYDSDSNDPNSKICSLVFDSGSHGSHVAGIIAGSFPDSKMNGVNPYAKILSLKISDSQVNGMETSVALIRAMKEIVKHNCHLANYSFGEPLSSDEKGRFMTVLEEYAFKYGITFVSSAGNNGPSITTIGAPNTNTDRTISVGAYTNSTYLKTLYNINTDTTFTEGVYEWSSRGPSMNNGMGVSIVAPGCALTSHPRWYKSNMQLCNGTSMSSPNATGMISLILSQFDGPDNYPHPYWIHRYIELTAKPVADLEPFSQGHGLIGHIPVNIKEYFTNKDCSYYYDASINSKKGIVSFGNDDNINYKIDIKPIGINSSFKQNEAIHDLIMSSPDLGINDFKFISTATSRPVTISLPNKHYSGYIKIFEPNTKDSLNPRYVGSIAVNQFILEPIKIGESRSYSNNVLLAGQIKRICLKPQGNVLSLVTLMNPKIKDKISIDIIQCYPGKGYDERSHHKTLTATNNVPFEADIVPNVPTEICIYTSWTTSVTETIDLNIACGNRVVSTPKNLYEMPEKIPIVIGRYDDTMSFGSWYLGDNSDNNSVSTVLELKQIVSKYHPIKAEIIDTDARYIDKDDKKLKLLRLSYKINKHSDCSYYINTNNRVYDSKVQMSGCITGFYHDRRIFFANYVPKKVKSEVDRIIIEFMDSDEKVLRSCMDTVLTVSRSPSVSIKHALTLIKGYNLIDLPTKMSELTNAYDGDYLKFDVLNINFMVIYRNKLCLDSEIKIPQDKPIEKYMKDFTLVKKFIEKAIIIDNQSDHVLQSTFNTDMDMEIVETALCFVDPDSFNVTNQTGMFNKFIDMSIEDRNSYELIGTLLFETNNDTYDDMNRFNKRLKTTHQHFNDQNLLQIIPYAVIDLVSKIVQTSTLDDVDNKMTIVSLIEKNMDYWPNCTIQDINWIRQMIMKNLPYWSNPSWGPTNNIKRLTGFKRKLNLMLETDEKVF